MIEKIKHFIDEQINPALAMHNGHLTVESYDDGILYVILGGGCQGCAASKSTLQIQISAYLTEEFPEVTGIVDLTDHEQGKNPHFARNE